MFCYQCEQTAKGSGCTTRSVCGKSAEVATMQDLLMYAIKDIARYAHVAGKLGKTDAKIDRFFDNALFATITSVNFDAENLKRQVKEAAGIRVSAMEM